MFKQLTQASSLAGLGLLFSGVAQLLATKGQDATAWAQVIGGVGAVLVPEKGAKGG